MESWWVNMLDNARWAYNLELGDCVGDSNAVELCPIVLVSV